MARVEFQLFPSATTEEALSPDVFQAPQFFVYPDAEWWTALWGDDAPEPPRPPTRAKYWTAYPLERLRSTVPLRGESRARARARAGKARAYTARLANFDRNQGSVRWRLVMESAVEAVTNPREGSVAVWSGSTRTPYQRLTRGRALTVMDIDGLFYDLARATVRSTTGIGKGPTGTRTDGRHGPDWYREVGVNQGLKEEFERSGITYENTVAYADRVVLEVLGA